MKITIEIESPVKNGMFDEITLSYNSNGITYKSNINFDFNNLHNIFQDMNSVAFDFLLISVIVYNVDRFVERKRFSVDGWRRELEIHDLPVKNIDIFRKNKDELISCLNFLTGDTWNPNFVEAPEYIFTPRRNSKQLNIDKTEFSKVSLFSGGLDSLIGVIDLLEQSTDKVFLCSHKDLGKEGSDQSKLLPELVKEYQGAFIPVCTKVGLGRKTYGCKSKKEATFRSRSLLFLGQAIFLAFNVSSTTEIIIPENGSITVNFPLTVSRRSSCSTRTTHPTFISKLNNFLNSIGIENKIVNPYQYKTKGEMFKECKNQELLNSIYKDSCSCAKRGHTHYWDNAKNSNGDTKTHCGLCLPCVYRRVSLFINDLDSNGKDEYGTEAFTSDNFDIKKLNQKSSNDFRAIANLVKENPSKEEIEKQLLINGLLDFDNLDEYSSLVQRTITQIRDWIESNPNSEIKAKAGIDG